MKLIVQKFQILCHVQYDLEISVKLTVQIGDCIRNIPSALCLRVWEFHAKPAFFCNLLNDDMYIDALITELFQICLVLSQSLGEGTL